MKISELHLPSSGLSVGNWRRQAVLHDIVLCSGIRHSLFWVLRIWQHWSGGLPERAGVAQRGNYSDGEEVRQGRMEDKKERQKLCPEFTYFCQCT